MPSRSTAKAVGSLTAALAGGLYLDNRYGMTKDIGQIWRDKQMTKAVGKRIAELGDHVSIYRMLELADPDAAALWFEGRSWTYGELKLDVDKLAVILAERGIGVNSSVAVFATNSPEMVITFCALCKLGAVPALVNTSLRSQTLAHCMSVANATLIICTSDLTPAILDLYAETSESAQCISLNLLSFPPLVIPSDRQHAACVTQVRYEDLAVIHPVASPLPKRTPTDPGILIYTSGTSGKPKAVNIKLQGMIVVSTPLPIDTQNLSRYFPLRTYSCLPLFHATGLFTGLLYCLGNGATFCIGRKFSASRFSQELVESRATRIIYVGELCRYLLRAPESKYDKAHSVIVASGNGMAKDVWNKFRSRFNIPEIREFYRSTEGVSKFDNMSSSSTAAGYVGFTGPIHRYMEEGTYLVRYDPTTEMPYRDPKTGFCVVVKAGEPGEAIGRVRSMAFYNEYLGNPKANEEKLIRDVFAKGDLFQRTGDLLVRDKRGWVGFLDRTGDTYRWRGENVSAGEVKEHISRLKDVIEVAVFAVKLDGYDGQAGAASITLSNSNDEKISNFMSSLFPELRSSGLAMYQMPRLVRITEQLETGATFKHAKEIMKTRTWDPEINLEQAAKAKAHQADQLFWLDGDHFAPLDTETWKEIKAARARL